MTINKSTAIGKCACLAVAIIVLFAASCSKKDDSAISVGGGTLCVDTPQFALCTSAPCKVDPSNPKSSICDCVVESGANWGKTPCKDRIPQGNELHSNFTPLQAGAPLNLKALVCTNKRWAVCIDAPCTKDPNDPTKAKCRCPIANTSPWLTFGGECDPAACNQLWSAGVTMNEELQELLDTFGRLGVPGADYPMCKSPAN